MCLVPINKLPDLVIKKTNHVDYSNSEISF